MLSGINLPLQADGLQAVFILFSDVFVQMFRSGAAQSQQQPEEEEEEKEEEVFFPSESCTIIVSLPPGYHDNHIVIRWFWAAVERFNNEQRLRLLQVGEVLPPGGGTGAARLLRYTTGTVIIIIVKYYCYCYGTLRGN